MKLTTISGHTFVDCLSADSVVVDIGAHVGGFTSAISERYSCYIRAFEPWRPSFMKLTEKMRNVDNVSMVNHAVTGSIPRNTGTIYDYGNKGYSCSLFKRSGGIYRGGVPKRVTIVELEEALDSLDHIDLLKIDCEGSEIDILMNAGAEFLQRCDQISVEFHIGASRGFEEPFTEDALKQCVARMTELGFNNMTTGKKNPDILFFKPHMWFPKYDTHGAYHWPWYRSNFGGYKVAVDRTVAMFPKEGTCLDIGCGDGLMACRLAVHGLDVHGIDFSQKGIELARVEAKRCKLDVKFRALSYDDIRYAKWDYVLCHNVIEHVEDAATLLAKIKEVTREFAIVSTGDGDKGGRTIDDVCVFTKSELEALFKKAGFDFELVHAGDWIYYKLEHHGD